MSSRTVTRAALGRVAKIGGLYDVRTESFLNDTLFSSKLGDEIVDTLDLGETVIELALSDSIEERYSKLKVEAELQVSVLSGMVKLAGSGAYLAEDTKSTRAQSMSLIYKLKTVNEELMFRQYKNKIDIDAILEQTDAATHVVVGIDWGAICSITCQYDNSKHEDATKVKGALSAEIQKLKSHICVKGSANVSNDDMGKEHHTNFSFTCKADVCAPDKEHPVSFDGAVDFARSHPSLVKSINNGKGVPLTYHIMPLEVVAKMCKSRLKLDTLYTKIDEGTVKKCTTVLQHITKKRQEIYDLYYDMEVHEDYILDKDIRKICEIRDEVELQESGFRAEIQQLVKSVRSGSEDISILEEFLRKHEANVISASRYDDDMVSFKDALKNAQEIERWKCKGITYIGKHDRVIKDMAKTVIVLYKTNNASEQDEYDKIQEYFMRLQATHAKHHDYAFVVIDQDMSSRNWPSALKKSTIYKYVKGKLISSDLYIAEGQDLEMCLIQFDKTRPTKEVPPNRTYVQLACPNALHPNGNCAERSVNWRCSKCKQFVEYNTDDGMFYCQCGKTRPTQSEFRCNDPNHDLNYVRYPLDTLNKELSRHCPTKEMNVLILGETGVGKSTWINGFQNYLQFDNLEEAMKSQEFPVLIPSSFTFTQDGKQTKIEIGETDTNEELQAGKSATKEPRSYVFFVDGTRIRLIDTPGIGDSEGIGQDRINVDKILSYLAYYDEIHAVCILLKPNNSRLTAMFRFCIQELLVQLHSSAKSNIVFCFTNARATFYQPGDTLPALNKELRDREVGIQATPDRYFCFDSEPFRFLACVKNGVQFQPEEIDTYAQSWTKSVLETKRLLEYIYDELKPHRVKETIGMNEARRIIVEMGKPLAEVAKTIDCNLQSAEAAKKEILLADSGIESLKKNLKFSGYDIKRVDLAYPRTVCTDPSCVRFVQVGTEQVRNTVYKQICHDHCYLEGIPTQTTNNPKLLHCRCINKSNETCRKCGHSYGHHMHITYDTEVFDKEFLSPKVQNEIKKMGGVRSQKEAFKQEIERKIEELKGEETFIMQCGAKFGSFLKANALIPYNDAVGDYLDMSIELEKIKPGEIRNKHLLEKMMTMKQEYIRERQILDNAIGKGNESGNIQSPDEVKQLQEELFQLKHFGPTLKNLFEGIAISNASRNKCFCEKIVPVSAKRLLMHEQERYERENLRQGQKPVSKARSRWLPWNWVRWY